MSNAPLEAFLARLYTEPGLIDAFLADPASLLAEAGIEPAQFGPIDRVGLAMAARSFRAKREGRAAARRGRRFAFLFRLLPIGRSPPGG